MIKDPVYRGICQSDFDFAGFHALNCPDIGGGTGHGIPAGGMTGQLLKKLSNTDYDANWATVSTGGGGGGLLPGWVNIKDAPYNAAGNGVTDDTAAIQAAVDALTAVGGGTIYFPAGKYIVGGALQDTSGRNAQILLPIIPQTSPPVTIRFIGALSPPVQFYYPEVIPSAAFSIIKSTLTGASGTAAFIAGKESGTDLWDNVMLVVRDMVFEAPSNPSFTMFNCFDTIGPRFEHVLIYAGTLDFLNMPEPTHTNAVAIKLAPSNHTASQFVNGVDVFGFYTGLQDGELGESHINLWACKQAVLVPFNWCFSTFRHLGLFHCTYGIVAAGIGYSGTSGDDGTHYMRVLGCQTEHATVTYGPPWSVTTYDVQDPSNLLIGDIKWLSSLAGVGNDHSFTKNGGANLHTSEIGTDQSPAFYIGTDARLVSITGGTKLQVRNPGTGLWADGDSWTNP